MRDKLEQSLMARISAIGDKNKLLDIFDRLNWDIDEDIFADVTVWATIKLPQYVEFLIDDSEKHLLESKHTQAYASDTKGVKLFFDGEWYINLKFNLKLRPEWIEIIES